MNKNSLFSILILLSISSANAATLTENFDDPFTLWRTGFMGVNTNLESYYIEDGNPNQFYRGTNPNGIWLANGNGITSDAIVSIDFNLSFGSTITDINFAVGSYLDILDLEIFDISDTTLLSTAVVKNATTSPLDFYAVSSVNGIGGFRFLSGSGGIEGNTNIDSITITTIDSLTSPIVLPSVPIPATFLLFGTGLIGLAIFSKRRKTV